MGMEATQMHTECQPLTMCRHSPDHNALARVPFYCPVVHRCCRLDTAIAQALRHKPEGVSRGGVLWRASREWSLTGLNASSHALVLERAACDHALYVRLLERLRISPPVFAQGLDADACAQAFPAPV